MKVCVLSSGSKGNSTLVITDKVKILIDLGTTTSYVEAALNNLNVDVKEISHILITHSHVDHIKGLKVFIKRYNPVILVTEDMKNVLEKELGNFRYEYYEDNKIVGVDVDFAQAIADKLGMELTVNDMEFDSIIAAVDSGKADFGAAGMTVTKEREKQVDFSDSYYTGKQMIIVKK